MRSGICAIACVVVSIALAGCEGSAPDAGNSVPPSRQELFKTRLLADDASLDRGALMYEGPGSMSVGGSATLTVDVVDLGHGTNGTAEPPQQQGGWVVFGQDVPAGGIVGVRASCDGGLTCDPQSTTRQPVLAAGMTANWSWQISATRPGTTHIFLVATTYDQNSSIPLHETTPIEITVSVSATFGYRLTQVGTWLKALIGLIGVGAIVGAAQAAWKWRAKRKRRTSRTKGEPPGPAPQADPE